MRTVIDIETRSVVDLRKCGVYVYAEHSSTDITHIGWKTAERPSQIWRPLSDAPMPTELARAFSDPTAILVAHNAGFERTVLGGPPGQKLGIPFVSQDLARWDCTAARAAQVGLPRALERACMALSLPVQKDREGHALMLRCCKPRSIDEAGNPTWWDDETRMSRLDKYCLRDVEAEYQLDRKLPALSPTERQVWEVTECMNERGVSVDRDLLQRVLLLVKDAQIDLDARISELTDGAVPRVSNASALTRWLIDRGIKLEKGIAKSVVEELLAGELDDLTRQVLELRRDGGGSSSRKHTAIDRRLPCDNRIRGELIYGGAVSTLRWSSNGAQLQNLPRGGNINVAAVLRDLSDDDAELAVHGPPLKVASELLRPIFVAPPGYWLAKGDYSQIEARVLAWIAGQHNVVAAFRAYDAGTGPDLYKVAAAGIYRIPIDAVDKNHRQIGKTAMLALGYYGGKRAFQSMAKAFGIKVSDEQAEQIKIAWRAANPYIVQLWYDLNDAAIEAVVRTRTVRLPRHNIEFRCNRHALAMRLPSGRSLLYWQPTVKEVRTPWGSTRVAVCYHAEDTLTRRWTEFAGYGGTFCENAVQAIARDIMADALIRLHADGLSPVLCVHDEAVCEVSKDRFPNPDDAADAVKRIMLTAPAWANGLPIAVDASANGRYLKE